MESTPRDPPDARRDRVFQQRRASRSFPFISKTMNCNFISLVLSQREKFVKIAATPSS